MHTYGLVHLFNGLDWSRDMTQKQILKLIDVRYDV